MLKAFTSSNGVPSRMESMPTKDSGGFSADVAGWPKAAMRASGSLFVFKPTIPAITIDA